MSSITDKFKAMESRRAGDFAMTRRHGGARDAGEKINEARLWSREYCGED